MLVLCLYQSLEQTPVYIGLWWWSFLVLSALWTIWILRKMSILSAGDVLKQFCKFCCPTRSCQPEKTQSTRSQMIVASGFWLSVWKLLPFCETKGRGQGVWPELWSLISRPPWGLGWMPCLMSRKSFWKSKNLNRSKRKQIWRRLQTKCPCSWRRKLVNLQSWKSCVLWLKIWSTRAKSLLWLICLLLPE